MNTEATTATVEFTKSASPCRAERSFFSKLATLERAGVNVHREYEPATACFGEKLIISASVSSFPGSGFGCFVAWTLERTTGRHICTKRTSITFYGTKRAGGNYSSDSVRVTERDAMRIFWICTQK
jgi:hypothetical protein